jgi:hypothetical protein
MPQNTRDKPAGIEKVSNNHQSIFFFFDSQFIVDKTINNKTDD